MRLIKCSMMILVLTLSRINCAELEEAPTGCEDRLEWKHPTTNETCEDVKVMTNDEKEKICESIDTYKGSTAFSACCACGGGFWPEYSYEKYNQFIKEENQTESLCLDYPDWFTIQQNTCDNFINNYDFLYTDENKLRCDKHGYLESLITGENASEACCICGGGSESTSENNLVGVKLRMGVPNDAFAHYLLFNYTNTTTGISKSISDGAVMNFTRQVAISSGLGLYPVQSYSLSARKMAENNTNYNTTWDLCYHDVVRGHVDTCLGPYLKTIARGNQAISTKPVFKNDYYMVVPLNKQEAWKQGSYSVFQPFHYKAWIAILVMMAYVAIALQIVRDPTRREAYEKRNFCLLWRKILHVSYVSIKSFVSSEIVDESSAPKKSEKLIVIGFTLFTFFVITAYTANLTSYMVRDSTKMFYKTLDEVLKDDKARICYKRIMEKDIFTKYAALKNKLSKTFRTESLEEMLDELKAKREHKNKTCTVAIVPISEYEVTLHKEDKYCKTTKVLPTKEFFLRIEMAILFSPFLENLEEIVEWFNKFIDNGQYTVILEKYKSLFEKNNFETPDIPAYLIESFTKNGRLLEAISSSSSAESLQTSESTLVIDENHIYSYCKVDKDKDDDGVLTAGDLSLPLIITFTCSTIGILTFVIEKIRNKDKMILGEEEVLREKLCRLSTGEILSELNLVEELEKSDVDAALDMLPDRSGIIELLLQSKLSSLSKYRGILMSMSTSELYDLFLEVSNDKYNLSVIEEQPLMFDDVLSDEKPKKAMINIILKDADKTNRAIDILNARCKDKLKPSIRDYRESKYIEKYEISELADGISELAEGSVNDSLTLGAK